MSEFGKDKMPASHQFLQIFPRVSEPDMFPEIVISIASMSGSLKGIPFLLYDGIAYVLHVTESGILHV